jgi:hypothetical protein
MLRPMVRTEVEHDLLSRRSQDELGVHNRQTRGSEDGGEITSAFTSRPISFLAPT